MKLVLTSALFGALFLVSGCTTQCEAVSNSYNACTVAERSAQVDTLSFCGQVDALNQRAASAGATGCTALWTAHLQCWQQHIGSICKADFVDCDDSANAWQDCVIAYCDGLPTDKYDPACQGYQGTDFFGPLSLPSPFQSGF